MTAIIHNTKDGSPCGWYIGTFECPECNRECCDCMGAADDTPYICDDCLERTIQSLAASIFTDTQKLGADRPSDVVAIDLLPPEQNVKLNSEVSILPTFRNPRIVRRYPSGVHEFTAPDGATFGRF